MPHTISDVLYRGNSKCAGNSRSGAFDGTWVKRRKPNFRTHPLTFKVAGAPTIQNFRQSFVNRLAPTGWISKFDPTLGAQGSVLFSVLWFGAVRHTSERMKQFFLRIRAKCESTRCADKKFCRCEIFGVGKMKHYSVGSRIVLESCASSTISASSALSTWEISTECSGVSSEGLKLSFISWMWSCANPFSWLPCMRSISDFLRWNKALLRLPFFACLLFHCMWKHRQQTPTRKIIPMQKNNIQVGSPWYSAFFFRGANSDAGVVEGSFARTKGMAE